MWLSSKEFAEKVQIDYDNVKKTCCRAKVKGKKFCKIKSNILAFSYTNGIGHGGKILKIWSEPFGSEEEARRFSEEVEARNECGACNGGEIATLCLHKARNDGRGAQSSQVSGRGVEDRNDNIEGVCAFSKAPVLEQNIALNKERILKEWSKAKKMGKSAGSFIEFINSGLDSIKLPFVQSQKLLPLTANKLFAWQRAYKEAGLAGLIDRRGNKRESSVKTLGVEDLVIELLEARRGNINISSLHHLLHMKLDSMGLFDYRAYIAKEGEYVSYAALRAFVLQWKKANPLKTRLILRGEDAAVGAFLPAYGESNYKVDSINQVVEIDGTKLDAIVDVPKLSRELGIEIAQDRYVLISLIDTYSGVCSFHLSDTENSLGVARAVAKYISLYGKPQVIKGDNGSAFVSKYSQEVMARLGIEYERSPAYSGWCKPYVETNFKTLQNALTEWLSGYVGHSVAQRQAIEYLFSRAQRRLRKGQKTHATKIMSLKDMGRVIDDFTHVLNNRYLERLGGTPIDSYNAKSDEAVAVNAYELTLRLAPLQSRKVGKKGISYGGGFFIHPCLGGLHEVFVANNINDSSELFVFDAQKEFLCIAKSSLEGVSAEEAKGAQKTFKKALKKAKEELIASRARVEAQMPALVASVARKMKKPHALKEPCVNKVLQKELLLKEAREGQGDSILKLKEEINKQAPKRDLSFEAGILKKKGA